MCVKSWTALCWGQKLTLSGGNPHWTWWNFKWVKGTGLVNSSDVVCLSPTENKVFGSKGRFIQSPSRQIQIRFDLDVSCCSSSKLQVFVVISPFLLPVVSCSCFDHIKSPDRRHPSSHFHLMIILKTKCSIFHKCGTNRSTKVKV